MPEDPLQFEDFSLDRAAYELRRGGRAVHLERLPLEMLFLLVERRGQLVTRQEILESVWGKGVFVVDSGINTAIRKIRRALNDDPDAPRFVATVPAKGYRFVAPLRESKSEGTQLPSGVRFSQSSFVGRQREMAELRAGLEEAASGHGRPLLIAGAPGVGKTRLSAELARLAQESAMAVLLGHCSEQDKPVPYLPFVEVLENCLEGAAGVPTRLRMMLKDCGPELSRIVPKLKRLVRDLAPPLKLPPEQARRHLFNSVCDFIARLALEKPILLILEDLHWADAATLSLLAHLANRLTELPVALVVTFRDAEADVTPALAKTLEGLIRERDATRISLKGLAIEQVGLMIKGLSNKEPPPDVVDEIYAKTEGNPFFVKELVRHLAEENRLYDEGGELRSGLKATEFDVPKSVRLVVSRRLARLGESAQKMLEAAAVIGRSFSFEVLRASTQSDRLLESVEAAENAGLVVSNVESSEARFEFCHELVRQTVLHGLSAPRRQQLHLEVGIAIERSCSDRLADLSSELAHHFAAAGNAPKAVEYLIRSGRQAAHRYANLEAVAFFKRALEQLQKLPDDELRVREELKIQAELVQSLWILGSVTSPELRAAMDRRFELCERLGDSRELFKALGLMMSMCLNRDGPKALSFAQRELALAERVGDPTMLAHANAAIGYVLVLQGEFVTAREYIEKGLASNGAEWRPSTRVSWASWAQSPGLSALAGDLWFLGYPDQALRHLTRALAATEIESDPFWRALGWWYAVRVYVCMRYPQTLEVARSLVAYVKEHELRLLNGIASLFVLWAEADQGDAVEAIGKIKAETYRGEPVVGWVSLMMADMCAKARNAVFGLTLVAQGLRVCDESGVTSHKAELHRLHGELLLIQDPANAVEAEHSFRMALEVSRQQHSKSWELRAAMSVARLLAKQNRHAEARAMLSEVYNWFTEGFDTADLKDAKAILNQLNR
jgi:DNA-binding winged helix-turn-helix (wHTH) protein/tetratricopeptide (TPR) repeat protein